MRFKIDRASLIVGSKFKVFALFYFVFEGNFPSTGPRGANIWRGDLTDGFLRYRIGGLIHGGAYFRDFTVLSQACFVTGLFPHLKLSRKLTPFSQRFFYMIFFASFSVQKFRNFYDLCWCSCIFNMLSRI